MGYYTAGLVVRRGVEIGVGVVSMAPGYLL
jgi:hypothetical protein